MVKHCQSSLGPEVRKGKLNVSEDNVNNMQVQVDDVTRQETQHT